MELDVDRGILIYFGILCMIDRSQTNRKAKNYKSNSGCLRIAIAGQLESDTFTFIPSRLSAEHAERTAASDSYVERLSQGIMMLTTMLHFHVSFRSCDSDVTSEEGALDFR